LYSGHSILECADHPSKEEQMTPFHNMLDPFAAAGVPGDSMDVVLSLQGYDEISPVEGVDGGTTTNSCTGGTSNGCTTNTCKTVTTTSCTTNTCS